MVIEVSKAKKEMNLKNVNYKCDSSKNSINEKEDQLVAEQIQDLIWVRLHHCKLERLNIMPKVQQARTKIQVGGNEHVVFLLWIPQEHLRLSFPENLVRLEK